MAYRVEVKGKILKKAVTVVESDTVDFADGACNAVYVGGTGTIEAVMADGSECTFSGLLAGTVYPISITRVKVASTATGVIALY